MEFIATLKHEVYRNKDWAVQKWKTEDGDTITVTGEGLPEVKGTSYVLIVDEVTSGKYEGSFKLISASKHKGKSKEDVINFLSSIKGFGPKTAKKIFDEFGENTYSTIENDYKSLVNISGISEAKAEKLHKAFLADEKKMAFFRYIVPLGIEQSKANSFANIYKDDERTPIEIVQENPYRLTKVRGVEFIDADNVAKQIGFNMRSKERVLSACYCILNKKQQNGDMGMNYEQFKRELHKYLRDTFSFEGCQKMSDNLIKSEQFIGSVDTNGQYSIFTHFSYETEYSVATEILRLLESRPHPTHVDNISSELDLDQIDAVKMALNNNLSIITGGPGTGKTTVIKEIISHYNGEKVLMAPTGRAAARMKEVIGLEASTIHSKLKIFGEGETSKEKIDNSLVIIDEFSMVESALARNLFEAINSNCTVVICGDADQLPSVGAGAVLFDMLNSGKIPSKELKTVHRQAETSTLYQNIKATREGLELIEDDTFKFIESYTQEDVIGAVMDELNGSTLEDLQKTMCLCPFKKNEPGVYSLNTGLKEHINPLGTPFRFNGKEYGIGDYIMNLKNNKVAANGDVGMILSYDPEEKEIEVFINGEKAKLTEDDEIMHAYSSTVHKAQGSEANTVFLVLPDSNFLTRNLVYTAITRAKEKVVIFGKKKTFYDATKRVTTNKRITLLENFLKTKIKTA